MVTEFPFSVQILLSLKNFWWGNLRESGWLEGLDEGGRMTVRWRLGDVGCEN